MIVQYTLQGRAMAIDLATIQAVTGVDGIPDLCECAIACGSITIPLTPEAMFSIWREGLALSVGRMQRLWFNLDMGRIYVGGDDLLPTPPDLQEVVFLYKAIQQHHNGMPSGGPLTSFKPQPQEPAQ